MLRAGALTIDFESLGLLLALGIILSLLIIKGFFCF